MKIYIWVTHFYDPVDRLFSYSVNSSRRAAIENAISTVCEQLSEAGDVAECAKELRRSIYEEMPVGRTSLSYRNWKIHIDEMRLDL